MIDGIEGSGKSTILDAWKSHLANQNKNVFDFKKYSLEHGRYPTYDEIKPYEYIFTAEPTYIGIGKVIREELIKNGTDYPEQAIAEAYSLDRFILYKKIIIPALEDGKTIIQDRGVSTSLCYQSTNGILSLDFLAALPGNALALQHRPDWLILVQMSLETAQTRLAKRYEKQDDAIFDKIEFQQKVAATFASVNYQKLFLDKGTQITQLNTDAKIDIMKQESLSLFNKILCSNPR